jgi:uncharacterized membrane protein YeaQ/YmgE (transglycosylase-associated protein family)
MFGNLGGYARRVILAVFILLILLFVILPLVWHLFWVVFWAAVLGVIIGALGRLLVPGRNPIGVFATIVCGLVGSLVGGVIGHAIGGWFVTLLCEVGVAGASVAFWSATHRTSIGGRRTAVGGGRW